MSSGGVLYHLRAALHGNPKTQALWEGHRAGVKKFLENWNPKSETLVLVGPSGGYSLPEDFLNRFERIIAVEPDPLARIVFTQRFSVKPEWIKEAVNFENPCDFFKKIPSDSAILFCNLLGQISFRKLKKIRAELLAALQNYSWASYHDALSGENVEFDTELAHSGKRASLSQMKSFVYPKILNGTIELSAHQAPELFDSPAGLSYFYWQWRILPKRTHLIEGVFHAAQK